MKNQMHIFVAAATVAAGLIGALGAEPTQIGGIVKEDSKPEPVRASQIYGVRCGLRANRDKWQSSEIPKFKAHMPGQGHDDLWLATAVDQRFQIQVDGQWYGYAGREWIDGFGSHDRTQWIAKVGGYLSVTGHA